MGTEQARKQRERKTKAGVTNRELNKAGLSFAAYSQGGSEKYDADITKKRNKYIDQRYEDVELERIGQTGTRGEIKSRKAQQKVAEPRKKKRRKVAPSVYDGGSDKDLS